ncbi:MAG: caspase family protein [Planctomycetota bacterium]
MTISQATKAAVFHQLTLLALVLAASDAQAARKQAVLIGVERYRHPMLADLDFVCDDVTDFAVVLREVGFEVILLTDEVGKAYAKRAPTRENVDRAIARGLDTCKGKEDLSLHVLAEHGIQFGDGSGAYFCPTDGRPFAEEKRTLVSINGFYDRIKRSYAGTKLVLIDAFRVNPRAPRGRGITSDVANPI